MAQRRNRVDPRYLESLGVHPPAPRRRVVHVEPELDDDDDDDDDEDFDDDAQHDGDHTPAPAAPPAPAPEQGSTPATVLALKPPWHLWGNSQTIEAIVQDSSLTATRQNSPGQLVKITYKRPETWHFLLAAKLISGPASPVNESQIEVAFDASFGIGRSMVLLQSAGVVQDKAFENFFFQWGPLGAFPIGAQLYSTQVTAPPRVYRTDPPFPTGGDPITEVVAQDINVNCRVIALAPPGSASIGAKVVVEVSALFAPKTHVRPDWFRNRPEDTAFPGAEVEGQ